MFSFHINLPQVDSIMILSRSQAAGYISLREYMEEVGLQTITVSRLNHGRVRPIHGMPILFAPNK